MNYAELCKNMKSLKKNGFEVGTYGTSVLGRDLFFLTAGVGDYKIIIQGAIHAREHITTNLILKLCENLKNKSFFGAKFYFLPMTNPDGVEICCNGASSVKDRPLRKQVAKELETVDKGLYKANARLVDLNVNFPTQFGKGKQNLTYPHFENYIGQFPFSEPETQALAKFTKEIQPKGTISYHSKGEVIYFSFLNQKHFHKDFLIAKDVADETGYKLAEAKGSVGGYKDWCINSLGISSLTIEVGNDDLTHPIGVESLEEIYQKNKDVPLRYLKSILKYE
ncbi:MAG: M14 family zinc carboxypeptidase [Clostridia bacterium]